MKKIALFGASGLSGQAFLSVALAAGCQVRALVRQPAKLSVQHPHLDLIAGDVLRAEDVARTVQGADIVVSLFGHVKGSPEWLQTDGTRHIVAAMKQHGVHRIISLSGGGLPYPEKDQPKWMDHLIRGIMKVFVPKILHDAIRHHEVLAQSGLAWVIVRGPRLTNAPRKGQVRVTWVGVNAGTELSRADLADFIFRLIGDTRYDGQMPFVTN